MCSCLRRVKPELSGVGMVSLLLLYENKAKHFKYIITVKFYFGISASDVEEKPCSCWIAGVFLSYFWFLPSVVMLLLYNFSLL